MKTSEIIQYRRKFLGMTLEQVADAVGVNKSTIMRYERGEIEKMSVQNLVPLADALHCSPLYLLGKIDTPYEDQNTLPAPYIKKPHKHAIFHFRDTTMILKKTKKSRGFLPCSLMPINDTVSQLVTNLFHFIRVVTGNHMVNNCRQC